MSGTSATITRLSRSSQAATKSVFLTDSLGPSRLRGESAVPHSPPRRKERKVSAKKNSFQAAKDFLLSSTMLVELDRNASNLSPAGGRGKAPKTRDNRGAASPQTRE